MPIPIQYRTIPVTLRIQELLYDIDNVTWRRGSVIEDATPEKQASLRTHLTDEQATRDQVLRSIDNAIGDLLSGLGEYLTSEMHEASNVPVDGAKNIVIGLNMPQNYDDTSLKGLVGSCHNYIVERVLAEWYEQVNPEEADIHRKKSAEYLTDVIGAANSRRRPTLQTT